MKQSEMLTPKKIYERTPDEYNIDEREKENKI